MGVEVFERALRTFVRGLQWWQTKNFLRTAYTDFNKEFPLDEPNASAIAACGGNVADAVQTKQNIRNKVSNVPNFNQKINAYYSS